MWRVLRGLSRVSGVLMGAAGSVQSARSVTGRVASAAGSVLNVRRAAVRVSSAAGSVMSVMSAVGHVHSARSGCHWACMSRVLRVCPECQESRCAFCECVLWGLPGVSGVSVCLWSLTSLECTLFKTVRKQTQQYIYV